MLTYTTSELRASLAKIRKQVQIHKQRIQITHCYQPAFWLIPVEDCKLEGPSILLSEFRGSLTRVWEALQSTGGCVWITFHDRPVMAVVLEEEEWHS